MDAIYTQVGGFLLSYGLEILAVVMLIASAIYSRNLGAGKRGQSVKLGVRSGFDRFRFGFRANDFPHSSVT